MSEAYFWSQLFEQYNLPFTNNHYTDPKSWAVAFEKERAIAHNVNHTITMLYNRMITLDAWTNPLFFDILKVDGIDLTALITIQNSYILRTLNNTVHPSDCIAKISHRYGVYSVDIIYRPHLATDYYYEITKEAVEQILYNTISHGIKLLTPMGFIMPFIPAKG